jgi:hypothetical protein
MEWASLFSGKYFAMIVVYADETGTGGLQHGGKEPAPGVYGFLATCEMWERFRIDWKSVLDRHGAPYFHFRELNTAGRKKKTSPYHGWDDQKADNFIYDMATVASSGPVPFGGYVSIKKLYGGKRDRAAHIGAYRKAFENFFEDFTTQMNVHFPEEKAKTDFFFDESENKEWIGILNDVIRRYRRRDSRVGNFSFIDNHSERGMPCQAADILAYRNRQYAETAFEEDAWQKQKLLDFILSRNGFPKTHPRSRYAKYSYADWEALVKYLRDDKKLHESRGLLRGDRNYYPFVYNQQMRMHWQQMAVEMQSAK